MTDKSISDRLRAAANWPSYPTYDVRDDTVRVDCELLRSAAKEIDRLRDIATKALEIGDRACDQTIQFSSEIGRILHD